MGSLGTVCIEYTYLQNLSVLCDQIYFEWKENCSQQKIEEYC